MNLDIFSPHRSAIIRTRHWHIQGRWIPNALFWGKETWLKIFHSLISFTWHLRNTERTGTRLQGARDQDMKDFWRWYRCSASWFLWLLYGYHALFNIPNCVLKMKSSTVYSLWLNRYNSMCIIYTMSPSRIQDRRSKIAKFLCSNSHELLWFRSGLCPKRHVPNAQSPFCGLTRMWWNR